MSSSNFAIAINCIDGRIQNPVQKWLKENHAIDFVDLITENGNDGLFSNSQYEKEIKEKVLHSIKNNNSKLILISGHHDCDGNPVSKSEHIKQIQDAKSKIKSWNLLDNVIGVWVDENWQVEVVN